MTRTGAPSLLGPETRPSQAGPVECLGLTFADDDARRAYFLDRPRQHLADPESRRSEGFALGDVEDILALSDPPYFTACPNPFLKDVIAHHGRPYDPKEPYHSEPFALDVAAGKNDTIYMAHSYHTKVPHQAILRYILHYTRPSDLILDGFCGSGMTGVAAPLCGDLPPNERAAIEQEMPGVQWGRRVAILNDLSPAAAFNAHNYNSGGSRDCLRNRRRAARGGERRCLAQKSVAPSCALGGEGGRKARIHAELCRESPGLSGRSIAQRQRPSSEGGERR